MNDPSRAGSAGILYLPLRNTKHSRGIEMLITLYALAMAVFMLAATAIAIHNEKSVHKNLSSRW